MGICRARRHKDSFLFRRQHYKMQANFDWVRDRPAEVGSYPPNTFGLHEVHGNVSEWVQDCFINNYRAAPTDGSAVTGCAYPNRVLRGGRYYSQATGVRSAFRGVGPPDERDASIGLRVARTVIPGPR
jgi:formylglycine-generating enzyme required for sulfatase activity